LLLEAVSTTRNSGWYWPHSFRSSWRASSMPGQKDS